MFLIFGFISILWAQSLPQEIYQVDSIFKLMHQPFVNKMVQMKQNLVEQVGPDFNRFYNTNETICQLGQKVLPRQTAIDITYWTNNDKLDLIEEVHFKGCSQKLNFSVEVRTVGESVTPYGFKDLRGFEFDLKLKPSERIKDYVIRLPGIGPALRIFQERKNSVVYAEFYFMNNKILSLDEKKSANTIEQYGVVRPFSVSFSYNRAKWNWTTEHSQETFMATYFIKENYVEIRDSSRQLISPADYQKEMNDDVIGSLVQLTSMLFFSIDMEFPFTQFINSGQTNAKLLEELRNIQSFLNSGTQLPLIKSYIAEYLKAAQEGTLVDRRQKKEIAQ